ncbi:MAG: hypothetical protein RR370_02665 [Synergistaceae bacterium]
MKISRIDLFQKRLGKNISFFNNILEDNKVLIQEIEHSVELLEVEIQSKKANIAELEEIKKRGELFNQNIGKLCGVE